LTEGGQACIPESISSPADHHLPPREAHMPKLKLDLDTLRVESFESTPAAAERGTVAAHAEITAPVERSNADTCDRSCGDGGSCYVTWCWEVCWYTIDRDRE
jgi:hypothetical protein